MLFRSRDWKRPACDWGDQDLELAIERIRRHRPVPLVVFGHMHHSLRRQQGERRTLVRDRHGTLHLNAACVPRLGLDDQGRSLRHLSWITWGERGPEHLAHRWYGEGGELHYEQTLWTAPLAASPPIAALSQPPRC